MFFTKFSEIRFSYILVPGRWIWSILTADSDSAWKTVGVASWECLESQKLQWRHITRNFTIRNRDSRRLVFLNFLLWVKELVNSDCRFGFLVKNCIYSQLDMSRIPKLGPKIRSSQSLAQKNVISYHMVKSAKYQMFLVSFWHLNSWSRPNYW